MAHTPLMMSIDDSHAEILSAWSASYSPEANGRAVEMLAHKPVQLRLIHFIARLFFRGIYFPQLSKREWLAVVWENRRSFFKLLREGFAAHWRRKGGLPQAQRIETASPGAIPEGPSIPESSEERPLAARVKSST